ncbi:helix-turn-helix domain-containing protein [Psychroserpens algicola]|uniref:Helix-turn-helix transcriptional regulator n=1 Tax=Psychroserpens algicola TaxID=1719034 RepID=A0ABT0H5Y8_9FLAO|nr:helix-turn-helix transcriptional regulator [Psychroserpens algicola]MCK8479794.1 helix-turn-helix transcriptional regulator [Psychroserpens algicola]
MIELKNSFKYKNQTLIELATINKPFRQQYKFENETCLTFFFDTKINWHHAHGFNRKAGNFYLLQRCGNYIIDFDNTSFTPVNIIAFHFHAHIVSDLLDTYSNLFSYKTKVEISDEVFEDVLLHFFTHLSSILQIPELNDESTFQIKYIELLLIIYRASKTKSLKEFTSFIFDGKEIDFRNSIETYKYINISQTELASILNMSISSFKRKFSSIYNQSPGHYFKNAKLEKAKYLLEKGDLNITQIVEAIGYENLSHFTTNFEKKFSINPKKYQMNQKH